jgi:hypothetical protein
MWIRNLRSKCILSFEDITRYTTCEVWGRVGIEDIGCITPANIGRLLVICLAYANSTQNEFRFDDFRTVVDIRQSAACAIFRTSLPMQRHSACSLQTERIDSPSDTGELIGHGAHEHVARCSGFECIHPSSDRSSVTLDTHGCSTCSMCQNLAAVDVTALADAQQLRLASSRVLSWHHA